MSLAQFAFVIGGRRHVEELWGTLAFIGRYGHQPIRDLMKMSVRDLMTLGRHIGDYVKAEGPKIGGG